MYESTKDDWSDAISNIAETIYQEKICEPKISEMLLPWDEEEDIDVIFIKIIRDFSATEEQICYLAKNLVNLSDIDTLLYKTLTLKNENGYFMIASTLIRVLNETLTSQQIENLLFSARNLHDKIGINIDDAIDYLTALRGENEYADIPEWVSIREGENLSLLKTTMPGDGEDANKVNDIDFVARAHDFFYDIEKDEARGQGVGLSLEDAVQTVLSSYTDIHDNSNVNAVRVFGPMNRIKDANCSSNPYIPGPCRMLECICYEGDDLYEEAEIDMKYKNWFIGKCQTCLRKIRDISHAIRFPLEEGGWSGCYCSLDCIKKDINYIDEKINIRLNSMMFSLEDSGIMDRSQV